MASPSHTVLYCTVLYCTSLYCIAPTVTTMLHCAVNFSESHFLNLQSGFVDAPPVPPVQANSARGANGSSLQQESKSLVPPPDRGGSSVLSGASTITDIRSFSSRSDRGFALFPSMVSTHSSAAPNYNESNSQARTRALDKLEKFIKIDKYSDFFLKR